MSTGKHDNIFNSINNEYYHFTTSEKKVADYVLSHRINAQYMSISELAYECGVGEATISRFCKRLHLGGYNTFKLALAKSTVSIDHPNNSENAETELLPTDTIEEVCNKICNTDISAISQTFSLLNLEAIEEAVDLLYKSNKVLCLGQGASSIMAQEATHLFSTVTSKFQTITDSHIQTSVVATLGKKDVIMFFSYSGSTKELMELLPLAKNTGAKTILVTRYLKSPGADKADIVLQCGSIESPLQLGSIPARLAQLYLIDVLYHQYVNKNPKKALEQQEKIADALTHKHL